MAPTRMMSEIDFTKTQLVVFWVILMLAVDTINPVKIVLHVFPQIKPWHVSMLTIALMVYVFISELKELLYFSVKVFFHSILSIFFREVEIVGRDNIPQNGPVIFTSNHANQFIDSVVLLCTCQHKISYLIAEKSWNRRIIGDIAWAMSAVPVKRAQDSAKSGSGNILLTSLSGENEDTSSPKNNFYKVNGKGTKFTSELAVRDKLRLPNCGAGLKVMKIDDDVTIQVDATDYLRTECKIPSEMISYEIMKRIDQKRVYEKVLDCLANRGGIGIFPEGGSHDRTDLLPLKVGVALIAYSALERDGLSIPIVPVGLNYFNRHRFRGRAIVEFGNPVYIDSNSLGDFKSGGEKKRKACNELLGRIEDSMRSVIVSTPDYQAMKIIHAARRLYKANVTTSAKQDLTKRFAEGYKQLLMMSDGNPPAEWLDLQNRLSAYQKELDDLGLRDHQVPALSQGKDESHSDTVMREMRLPYHICHLVLLLLLAAIPALFLNLPVGLVARLYANRKRKKALAASKVKLYGYDVMLSEKVVLCIVLVPSLWLTYGLLLLCFTNLDGPAIALALGCIPMFSYMGIMAAEAGMVEWKDVKPFYLRLFPSVRRRMAKLPLTRVKLQHDLRMLIKEIGPQLGKIYHGKKVNWAEIQEERRKAMNSKSLELKTKGNSSKNS